MLTLRYAWRSLARNPGFVVLAVLALGVGLGLSTTMFAVIDAIVNPYVPYRDPASVYSLNIWLPRRPPVASSNDVYQSVRGLARSFAEYAPWTRESASLESGGFSREIIVGRVAPSYFSVVGIEPVVGRVFHEGDGDQVIVLSQALYRRLFGLRFSVEGARVTLGANSYDVVGVLPRGTQHPSGAEAWLPLHADRMALTSFSVMVRLRRDVTMAQAADEMRVMGGVLTEHYGARGDAPIGLNMNSLYLRYAQLREIHKAMVGAALLVLIVACVNLANLTLARGLARQHELALRLALGASQNRVIAQMFVECAAISVAGSLLGALFAIWGCDVLANKMPTDISWVGLMEPRLSWRVFGWSALAAGLASIAFGLWPAVRIVTKLDMAQPIKEASGTTTGRVKQRYSPLVVAEVSLALVLLMGGGLLVRTVNELLREGEFGFNTGTLWRAEFDQFRRSRREGTPNMTRQQILELARGVPGVVDAAYEGANPALGGSVSSELTNNRPNGRVLTSRYAVVTPSYLRVLGLPVSHGRDFHEGDASIQMVAIVDPVAAAKLYPDTIAVGKMLKLGAPLTDAGWVPIVGIARNPRVLDPLDEDMKPYVWVVAPANAIKGALLFRTAGRDTRGVVELRRRLAAIPDLRLRGIENYAHRRDAELASRRFLAGVFVIMGVVALALAALGLYAVLSYAVSQRMREFAVRIALGAESVRLYRLVLHDALVMLLAGIGIGAGIAFLATRYIDSVVVSNVYRTDVISLVASEALLIVVGLAAAFLPARRAVRANPLDIMRAV